MPLVAPVLPMILELKSVDNLSAVTMNITIVFATLFYHTNSILTSLQKNNFLGYNIAFFFVDIDNFAYINSLLGYNEGNNIIKRFSDFLKFRYENHLIARLSADEFLIIYKFAGSKAGLESELAPKSKNKVP